MGKKLFFYKSNLIIYKLTSVNIYNMINNLFNS